MNEETIQVKRILFCTDFSPNANIAFTHAIEVAQRYPGAELHLLHVIPAPDAQYWKSYVYMPTVDVDQMAKDAFDKRVSEEYESMLPKDISLTKAFRIGKAYAEIIRYADEIQADLIVMGRQGRGALESLFFGTVAEKVVKKAKCPVLVIPLLPQPAK